jgi:hypothetical protein
MKIRPYNSEKDYDYIYQALLSEGLSYKEMTFETDCVVIADIGFFTYTKELRYRFPFLHHFYVNRNQRNLKNFLRLLRKFKDTMFSLGFSMFVAQQPKDKPHLGQFIKFAKGVKLFTEKGCTYYLVPVSKEMGTRRKRKYENIQ